MAEELGTFSDNQMSNLGFLGKYFYLSAKLVDGIGFYIIALTGRTYNMKIGPILGRSAVTYEEVGILEIS